MAADGVSRPAAAAAVTVRRCGDTPMDERFREAIQPAGPASLN